MSAPSGEQGDDWMTRVSHWAEFRRLRRRELIDGVHLSDAENKLLEVLWESNEEECDRIDEELEEEAAVKKNKYSGSFSMACDIASLERSFRLGNEEGHTQGTETVQDAEVCAEQIEFRRLRRREMIDGFLLSAAEDERLDFLWTTNGKECDRIDAELEEEAQIEFRRLRRREVIDGFVLSAAEDERLDFLWTDNGKECDRIDAELEEEAAVAAEGVATGGVAAAAPVMLSEQVQIIKSQLGLGGGNMAYIVRQAAAQLGVEIDGRPLIEVAASCVQVLGALLPAAVPVPLAVDYGVTVAEAEAEAAELQLLEAQARCVHAASALAMQTPCKHMRMLRHANAMPCRAHAMNMPMPCACHAYAHLISCAYACACACQAALAEAKQAAAEARAAAAVAAAAKANLECGRGRGARTPAAAAIPVPPWFIRPLFM